MNLPMEHDYNCISVIYFYTFIFILANIYNVVYSRIIQLYVVHLTTLQNIDRFIFSDLHEPTNGT